MSDRMPFTDFEMAASMTDTPALVSIWGRLNE